MISGSSESARRKTDLEEVAWLYEQLFLEAGAAADRPKIRRALEEATETLTERPEDRWWEWLGDTGRSLGLKCRVVDCTSDQIAEIAREGGRIIARIGDGQTRSWKGVGATHRRKLELLQPLHDQTHLRLSASQLRESLELKGRDDVLRCLVIEPQAMKGESVASDPRRRTPLRRLIALLQPEWSDIWIVVVFALVTGLLALATPLAVETLVNTVAFGRLLQPVLILALMLLAFLSFSAALRALQTYVVEIIQRRLFARVAADLAYRLPRVDVAALDRAHGHELVNRFFDVVTVQKVSAQLLLDGISLILAALIGMAVLAFYHPWLLGFDVVLLAMIAFTIIVLGRGATYTSIKESKTKYQMAAWLEDLIGCPTAFRHAGAAEFALDRADHFTYDYLTARKAHFRVLMRQIVFALVLQAFASTALLGLGGWLVISAQLTLGQLVASELIVTVIVGAFAKLGKHMESYYDLLAAVDKLGALFDLPMEDQDGLPRLPDDGPATVELYGVGYESPSGQPLLDSLNLSIAAGERVMICGPSGSGKSLLLDLLFGTRMPSAGRLTISGIDPRDLRPDALRKHVTLARDIEVFSGTVAENVHLERPDISTNDVREALEQVSLLSDVQNLPDGLDTVLVESGFPLTTNQARKLMLARAIVARPNLLLVDGLIDALPDEDAEHLTQFLVEPSHPWTLVMVTGRSLLLEAGTRTQVLGGVPQSKGQDLLHAS